MTNRHKSLLELGERLADRYPDTIEGMGFEAGFAKAVDLLLPVVDELEYYTACYNCCSDNRQCTSDHRVAKEAFADLDKRLNNKGDRE